MPLGEVCDLLEEEIDRHLETIGAIGVSFVHSEIWDRHLHFIPCMRISKKPPEETHRDSQSTSVFAAPDNIFQSASSFLESQLTCVDEVSPSVHLPIKQQRP